MTTLQIVVRLSFLAALIQAAAFSACLQSICSTGTQKDGSQYLVCLPEPVAGTATWWFSRTDMSPQASPSQCRWISCRIGGVSLPQTFNQLGYGFAASSYSKNGLAIVEGVNDTKNLIQNVIKPPNFPAPNRV